MLRRALLALTIPAALSLPLLMSLPACSSGLSVPSRPKLDPPSKAETQSFAKASNAFGLDLYRATSNRSENVAMSPASVSLALAMTWPGAKGETSDQMRKVLHFEGDPAAVAQTASKLMSSLQEPSRPIELRIGNQLFGEQSIKLEQGFVDMAQASFGAPLVPVDFKSDPAGARVNINHWVEEQTEDRIKELIPANAITKVTRLVLVNAIYFLGEWYTPFEKDSTFDAPFKTASGEKNVPTMHETLYDAPYAESDGMQALSLRYKGGGASMLIVMPSEGGSLADVEKALTAAAFDDLVAKLRPDTVEVALPKFEIDPAESLSLGDTLASMGMPLAFDEENADFTAMYNPPEKRERLHISKVFHKAFVRADEKGTEAAAATAVLMAEGGAAMVEQHKRFTVDRPFLFILRDHRTGLILFIGKVGDPTAKG